MIQALVPKSAIPLVYESPPPLSARILKVLSYMALVGFTLIAIAVLVPCIAIPLIAIIPLSAYFPEATFIGFLCSGCSSYVLYRVLALFWSKIRPK